MINNTFNEDDFGIYNMCDPNQIRESAIRTHPEKFRPKDSADGYGNGKQNQIKQK